MTLKVFSNHNDSAINQGDAEEPRLPRQRVGAVPSRRVGKAGRVPGVLQSWLFRLTSHLGSNQTQLCALAELGGVRPPAPTAAAQTFPKGFMAARHQQEPTAAAAAHPGTPSPPAAVGGPAPRGGNLRQAKAGEIGSRRNRSR